MLDDCINKVGGKLFKDSTLIMALHYMLIVYTFIMILVQAEAQLRIGYYANTCPFAESIVKAGVIKAALEDPRAPASLLRLHFHDCFVGGCDASILLDVDGGEKTAFSNVNSARGFEYIDDIKSNLENLCPQTVSCADILAIAARDAIVWSGGQGWPVWLGRRDGRVSLASKANAALPSPFSDVATLNSKFQAVGLDQNDMITLSGSHTIGYAKCSSFSGRLFNFTVSGKPDPSIDPIFLKQLQSLCPQGGDPTVLSQLDAVTVTRFDNVYYKNLVAGKGLLFSDEVLFVDASTTNLVQSYSQNEFLFQSKFADAMVKMGNISPILAPNGEIRVDCRLPN